MSLSRYRHYKKCQKIIDNIHKEVAERKFLKEEECYKLFGRTEYNAFIYEMRFNTDTGVKDKTAAMEWAYQSRHFEHKASAELRTLLSFWFSAIALVVSVATFIFKS